MGRLDPFTPCLVGAGVPNGSSRTAARSKCHFVPANLQSYPSFAVCLCYSSASSARLAFISTRAILTNGWPCLRKGIIIHSLGIPGHPAFIPNCPEECAPNSRAVRQHVLLDFRLQSSDILLDSLQAR